MAAKGYCTSDDVAAFLGLTLTEAQETHCDNLIERAEVDIDEETGRGWLVGEQTDEIHYPAGRMIMLRYTPVESVETITGRPYLGEAEEELTENVDYEVRDLTSGLIRLVKTGYDRYLISYTPVEAVPLDIVQACIEVVANRMQPHLQAGSYGLDSFSLPDLTVNFSRSHVQAAWPPSVQQTLDRYRYRVQA